MLEITPTNYKKDLIDLPGFFFFFAGSNFFDFTEENFLLVLPRQLATLNFVIFFFFEKEAITLGTTKMGNCHPSNSKTRLNIDRVEDFWMTDLRSVLFLKNKTSTYTVVCLESPFAVSNLKKTPVFPCLKSGEKHFTRKSVEVSRLPTIFSIFTRFNTKLQSEAIHRRTVISPLQLKFFSIVRTEKFVERPRRITFNFIVLNFLSIKRPVIINVYFEFYFKWY